MSGWSGVGAGPKSASLGIARRLGNRSVKVKVMGSFCVFVSWDLSIPNSAQLFYFRYTIRTSEARVSP